MVICQAHSVMHIHPALCIGGRKNKKRVKSRRKFENNRNSESTNIWFLEALKCIFCSLFSSLFTVICSVFTMIASHVKDFHCNYLERNKILICRKIIKWLSKLNFKVPTFSFNYCIFRTASQYILEIMSHFMVKKRKYENEQKTVSILNVLMHIILLPVYCIYALTHGTQSLTSLSTKNYRKVRLTIYFLLIHMIGYNPFIIKFIKNFWKTLRSKIPFMSIKSIDLCIIQLMTFHVLETMVGLMTYIIVVIMIPIYFLLQQAISIISKIINRIIDRVKICMMQQLYILCFWTFNLFNKMTKTIRYLHELGCCLKMVQMMIAYCLDIALRYRISQMMLTFILDVENHCNEYFRLFIAVIHQIHQRYLFIDRFKYNIYYLHVHVPDSKINATFA